MNKFIYYKVIQGNYGYGWDDLDFYEMNSKFEPYSLDDWKAYKVNLKAYLENDTGMIRVINRKELSVQP